MLADADELFIAGQTKDTLVMLFPGSCTRKHSAALRRHAIRRDPAR